MKSTKASASSSSGEETDVTGNTAGAAQGEKQDTGALSSAPKKSSRNGANSSLPAVADLLAVLQEDLRNLQRAGVVVEVIPNLHPLGHCAIVFRGVRFSNGDFLPVEPAGEK